jgi:hypothetical protein
MTSRAASSLNSESFADVGTTGVGLLTSCRMACRSSSREVIFPRREKCLCYNCCFIVFSSFVFEQSSTAIRFQYRKNHVNQTLNPTHCFRCCCVVISLLKETNAVLIRVFLLPLVSKAQKTSSPGLEPRTVFVVVAFVLVIS